MRHYIWKRVLLSFPLMLGISFFAFCIIQMRAGDPAEIALRVNQVTPSEDMIEQMRITLGLDQPFLLRYFTWLTGALQGDLGSSYVTSKPVLDQVLYALPNTLSLAFAALLIILFLSILLGTISAVWEGTLLDKGIRLIVFVCTAMPSFWIGILLIWLLAVKMDLFATSGMSGIRSVFLPAITLALAFISTYIRLIRGSMIKNKNENDVMYARACGLPERQIMLKVFKKSIQSSLTGMGMSIPKLIAGSVIVENVFAWPGIGRLCVTAIFQADLPMIQAYIVIMGVLFVLCNLLVDVLNMAIDPRLRKDS